MKFFPSTVRVPQQRPSGQPASPPPADGPSDGKEVLLLSAGILALTMGIGGLLMYSEEAPSSAKASPSVKPTEFVTAFSTPESDPPLIMEMESASDIPAGHPAITSGPAPSTAGPLIPEQAPAATLLVRFAFSQATLSDEQQARLRDQVNRLPATWTGSVHIQGHTDLRGSDAYNRALGARRAEAVKGYLVSLGLEPERLSIESLGKDMPVCLDDLPSCHTLNRRAEVEWLDDSAIQTAGPPSTPAAAAPSALSLLDTSGIAPAIDPLDTSDGTAPAAADPVMEPSTTPELVTPEVIADREAQL